MIALDSPELFNLLFTPEEIEEAETQGKIDVAYHEAGHAVVALELRGNRVLAYIERNPNGPSFGERAWTGKCQWWGTSELLEVIGPAVGVAGEIAVLMLRGEWNDESPWRLGPEDFNEIDAKRLSEANVVVALRDAGEILAERWPWVEAIAQALLKEESLTNGMILELIGREAA